MLGLQVTTPDFPGVGNNVPVGILFLLHIAVAEFSLGAITLAVAAEWHHVRTHDPRTGRYARSLVNSYYLIFSLGATLAVFAIVLITGLFGREVGELFNRFLWLIGVAFGLFLVLAPLLAVYRNTFDRLDPARHALLGTGVLALQTLFMVLIVGIDAYLINPVDAGLVDPVFNPVYWPLLIHRLVGNISWAALFCAAYAAIQLRRATGSERTFQSWAARVNLRVGLIAALLMPIGGFALLETIRHTELGYFDNLVSGGTAAFMVAQECLVGVILIGGNVALASETGDRRLWSPLAWGAIALSTAGMALAALPSAVLGDHLNPLRYWGLGIAMLVTALHLGMRMRGPARRQDDGLRATGSASRVGRSAIVAVGTVAVVTSLLMGYIKEHARGDYAVYGELRQSDAHQPYTPGGNLYP